MKNIHFIAVYCALFCLVSTCIASDELPVNVRRLSDRAIVLRVGDNPQASQVVAVAGEKGIVVFDTFLSPGYAAMIRQRIAEEFGRDDFAWVVNTHHHFDHTNGNQAFDDVPIIGHDYCPVGMKQFEKNRIQWLSDERNNYLPRLRQELNDAEPGSDEARQIAERIQLTGTMCDDLENGYKLTPPTLTFSDRLTLDLGDISIVLTWFGHAHTDGDIVAWIPEEGLYLVGDQFWKLATSWCLEFDVTRWIRVLDETLSQSDKIRHVFRGHREMTIDELKARRNYLADMQSAIARGVEAGDSLESMENSLGLNAHFAYLSEYVDFDDPQVQWQHSNNILIFREQLQAAASDVVEARMLRNGVDDAIAWFDRIKSGGTKWQVSERDFNRLGYKLMYEKHFDEAEAVFQLNIRQFPDSINVYSSMAEFYLTTGDRENAVKYYTRVRELNPDNVNAVRALANIDVFLKFRAGETRETVLFKPGEKTGLPGPYLGQTPPAGKAEVFAPGIVSTFGGFEFSCTWSPDGKELYFNRSMTILVSRLMEDGWTAPEPVAFTGGFASHEAHVSADNRYLYYGSYRPVEGQKPEDAEYAIWRVERTAAGWGNHTCLGKGGGYVTTTRDGDIYLTDTRFPFPDNAIARVDVENDQFAHFERLGGGTVSPAPNTFNGRHPCIAPDGSWVIFDAYDMDTRWGTFFISFRLPDGSWSDALRLGDDVNTGHNICPSLSPDGKYLFFYANNDIFWVSTGFLERYRIMAIGNNKP